MKLTKENILSKITKKNILQFYLPKAKPGKCILSPFRNENTPSFYISKSGENYRDMGDSRYRGDAFSLVEQLFNISFYEALQKINIDFGLGLAGGIEKNYQYIVASLPISKPKKPVKIDVIPRQFSLRELEYWNKHLQSRDDLKKEEIYAIDKAYINNKLFIKKKDELSFAYYFPELDKWKLYHPERPQKHGKWFTNVYTGYVEKKEQLITISPSILTSSRKDRIVLQKLYPYISNSQNETIAPFNTEFIKFIKDKVPNLYIGWNSDDPGVKNCQIVTQEFGYNYINPPKYLLIEGIKDWAEWVKRYGVYPITHFLLNKLKL